MASTDQTFLDRVFAAKSQEETRNLYDQWASSYNTDMETYSFTAPRLVAQVLSKYLKVPPESTTIVDAGCGSGLVGVELNKLGFHTIDGLDLSEGMLKVAEKTGAYRNLKVTDLTKRLEADDSTYDALTCCGTFTHGHLGPDPLPEMARIVKSGGVLAVTILESFWKEGDFAGVVKGLEKERIVEVLENDVHNYRKFGQEESGGLVEEIDL
ncbi:hypothetical protein N0V90_007985 [Kalmusia sp. IMI 367209]|nr:hypothetical protein N0V90_007985 [Kalmusia sp. IMI 367209]